MTACLNLDIHKQGVVEVNEYILISRDGEYMLMVVETDADSFLDLLLDFKATGFHYQCISKEEYYRYKEELSLDGYRVANKKKPKNK